uniref:Uncharacterized protein n=1 Tax=Arundo donax TaxID=35708 RepID=A0A0A9CT40_ARUDO
MAIGARNRNVDKIMSPRPRVRRFLRRRGRNRTSTQSSDHQLQRRRQLSEGPEVVTGLGFFFFFQSSPLLSRLLSVVSFTKSVGTQARACTSHTPARRSPALRLRVGRDPCPPGPVRRHAAAPAVAVDDVLQHLLQVFQRVRLIVFHVIHHHQHLLHEVGEILVIVVEGVEEPGVVHGPLPLVGQNGVRLLDPLEPPLGLAGRAGVARPPVRVPLQGEPPVGGAYVGGGGVLADAEQGVVAARRRAGAAGGIAGSGSRPGLHGNRRKAGDGATRRRATQHAA